MTKADTVDSGEETEIEKDSGEETVTEIDSEGGMETEMDSEEEMEIGMDSEVGIETGVIETAGTATGRLWTQDLDSLEEDSILLASSRAEAPTTLKKVFCLSSPAKIPKVPLWKRPSHTRTLRHPPAKGPVLSRAEVERQE